MAFIEDHNKGRSESLEMFWINTDGQKEDIIVELAKLADYLHGEKLSSEDRKEERKVISVIKTNLYTRNNDWILCLDNADEAENYNVSSI